MSEGSTAMWADMLGLGPLLQTVQDPNFHAHIQRLVDAIIATHARCERIENKLNLLIVAVHERQHETVPERVERIGTGTTPLTGDVADDGARRDERPRGAVGKLPRGVGR